VFFRQLLNDETACASYLLGCKTSSEFAVVDPHVDLVDRYLELAGAQGASIVAVFDTHVQADHDRFDQRLASLELKSADEATATRPTPTM